MSLSKFLTVQGFTPVAGGCHQDLVRRCGRRLGSR